MVSDLTKILCIDDEEVYLNNLGDFLEECGYQVDRAGNAKTAIKKIKDNKPDVIIVDVHMPEQDGINLVCEMLCDKDMGNKALRPRIIYLTAMNHPAYQISARRIACDDYLIKPVDFAVVVASVEAGNFQ